MARKINVVYYVDTEDNTKGILCAIPSDKDLRSDDVVENIVEELKSTFAHNSLTTIHAHSIALSIAQHNYASMKDYEFGVEEIPFFE